jgi:hypothetical protein
VPERRVLVTTEHDKCGNGTTSGQLHDVDGPEHLVTREGVLQVPRRDSVVLGLAEGLEVPRALLGRVLGTVAALSTPDLEERQPARERRVINSARQADDCSP